MVSAPRGGGGVKSLAKTPEGRPDFSAVSLSESRELAPDGLEHRGERLWLSTAPLVADEIGLVLLLQACRTADRLESLSRTLSGVDRELLRVEMGEDGTAIFVVDSALAEARQQANTLRQLVAALPLKEPDDPGDDGDGWTDELSG